MPKLDVYDEAPPAEGLTPYWTTTDGEHVRLYQGDVLETLRQMPSGSVQMICTSPPYWGLRSYSTCEACGKPINNRTCESCGNDNPNFNRFKQLEIGSERSPDCLGWARGENCAERDWQSACHVCRMVLVFREVRRVLRDDGVCWLNYGDSYGAGNSGGPSAKQDSCYRGKGLPTTTNLPSGNLVGVPWRVALALQADGWILRQDIIWSKPSPMPESVKNRCTKAHEYVFLLTKSQRYYYDAEAIKEPSKEYKIPDGASPVTMDTPRYVVPGQAPNSQFFDRGRAANAARMGIMSNKRSVWTIASQGYPGAHFATFPPKLIEPMILAGTSAHGCCANCGAPYRRVVEEHKLKRERPNLYVKYKSDDSPLQEEIWNPIIGHELYYAVSNHGRVKRIADGEGTRAGKILNPSPAGNGYLIVNLNGKSLCVHQAVLIAFVGTCLPGMVCRHLDGNKTNNNIRNLAWGTRSENEADKVAHGKSNRGERQGNAKMNASDIVEMWNLRASSRKTFKEIANMYGYQEDTVRHALKGDKWKHLGLGDCDSLPMGRTGVNSCANTVAGVETRTVGWEPTCGCHCEEVVPCIVCDPFVGSGTSCCVAAAHGRRSIGVDLSEKYLRVNAIPRITDELLSRPVTAHLVPRNVKKVTWK